MNNIRYKSLYENVLSKINIVKAYILSYTKAKEEEEETYVKL